MRGLTHLLHAEQPEHESRARFLCGLVVARVLVNGPPALGVYQTTVIPAEATCLTCRRLTGLWDQ